MVDQFFFSHARTALKYGLKALSFQPGDEVLIPDFICNVLSYPFEQLGIVIRFYPLKDDLCPNWFQLEKMIKKKSKAILMVHYFGQPQDITNFKDFCDKYSLLLIEDNAHGLGGKYGGKLLGTFGDIGISSPRKFFNIYSGGILYWNRKDLAFPSIPNLQEYGVDWKKRINKQLSRDFPRIKKWMKMVLKSRPRFEDPYAFQESKIGDYLMDLTSKFEYENIDWVKAQHEKQKAYNVWATFAQKNGLKPVFEKLYPEAAPQCFPAYAKNSDSAKIWFDWGWKNRYHVYSWPSLPFEIINLDNDALSRWKRLVCFSTNSSPRI